MKGPETIIFDDDDDDDFSIYTLTEEGNLIQLSDIQPKEEVGGGSSDLMATTTLIANLGIGRPLGGCFVPKPTATSTSSSSDDNDEISTTSTSDSSSSRTLYIADAVLGLTRITLHKNKNTVKTKTSKVEIVTTTAYDPETLTMTKINYADDVVVGPKTGMVYFTDGTYVCTFVRCYKVEEECSVWCCLVGSFSFFVVVITCTNETCLCKLFCTCICVL